MDQLWNDVVTWPELEGRFRELGVNALQLKFLTKNHNSKNQIAGFGNDLSAFGHLFPGPVTRKTPTSKKPKAGKPIYQTSLPWVWLTKDGVSPAFETKLIYYPQYPEVRLSGFLKSSSNPPSELLSLSDDPASRAQEPGRVLIFGPTHDRRVIGAVVSRFSAAAKYLAAFGGGRGKMTQLILDGDMRTSRDVLFGELLRIHRKGWLPSRRLRADGSSSVCNGTNCHGVTLESELGISANGLAAPDYLDWEVKAHIVKHLNSHLSSRITLLTPNPDGGMAKELGTDWLVKKYGVLNQSGLRYDLTGNHRAGQVHPKTGLEFGVYGFDLLSKKIIKDGYVFLRDPLVGPPVATWSFSKLLTHWQAKHGKAVFVPSLKEAGSPTQFMYGTSLHVGTGTSFLLFLKAVAEGVVVLDPGLNSKDSGATWTPHTRYQFRCSLTSASALYTKFEMVTI